MSTQQQGNLLLRIVLIVLAVIIFVPLLMMVFAMPMMGMMGWWGGSPGAGITPVWGIGMMLLFLLALLGVGYLLYRGLVSGQILEHDHALKELRTAYARGDLSDEEFEHRRQRLQRDCRH
ncbi:SHOCT domain-containing protein [Haloprofundus salinisoli]|uniref:SHOCT domain-containing protein n=1 Tax=Haloprofundus salinisoli TaxID=2876193 RepID=UPI001CCEC982|nr:SHOCT domain-containing protein [Haloprofundus salinisoli]